MAERKRVATHTYPRLQYVCTRALRAYVRAYVRSRVQKTEGLTLRGYLSVTRWQAYAPDAFRGGGAEAGCVGHNFQIYVQMFLSRGPGAERAFLSWGRCLS